MVKMSSIFWFLLLGCWVFASGASCVKQNVSQKIIYQNELDNLFNVPSIATLDLTLVSPNCRNKMEKYLDALQRHELWALKMVDATAKLPSGVLSGNVNQFGDYDECLSIPQAQYCLAEIEFKAIKKKPYLMYQNLIHSYLPFKGNFGDPRHRVPDFRKISWGICFPRECSSQDLEKAIETNMGVELRISNSMCKTQSQFSRSWTFGDYVARILLFTIVIMVIVSSIAVHMEAPFISKNPTKKIQLLLAFSLQNNWKQLIISNNHDFDKNNNEKKLTSSDNVDKYILNQTPKIKIVKQIQSVDGIRTLSAVSLLMCHKSVAIMYNAYINRTLTMENFGLSWTVIARTAIIYTDSFILLSGLLTARSLLSDLKVHGKMEFKKKLINRIFRITPNILAVILFCTYILPDIGSGPLWPNVVEHHAELCKQHMWRNLLYIHNHFGFENMCLTHTHQVGIDMQLFLFAPFLIYLWWLNQKIGTIVGATIAILSTLLRFLVTYQRNLSHMVYFGISVKQMFDTANFSYILPSHRATIYIMGIFLAFALQKYKLNLNKAQIGIMWIIALSSGLLAMIGPYHMARLNYSYNNIDAALFGAFSPILWGLCMSWVVFSSNNGCAGFFGEFLSWHGFKLFSKIAYAFYLVQFPVIFYFIGVQKSFGEFRPHVLLDFSETTIILILSVLLTVCVEMPFQRIYKLMFSKG